MASDFVKIDCNCWTIKELDTFYPNLEVFLVVAVWVTAFIFSKSVDAIFLVWLVALSHHDLIQAARATFRVFYIVHWFETLAQINQIEAFKF